MAEELPPSAAPPPAKRVDNPDYTAAMTTAEEDRKTAGQRRINIIWEVTQALIALSVIWSTLGAAIWITISDPGNRLMAFLFMTNIVSIVVGFYFGRVNHERIGGIGGKYEGR